MRRHKLPPPEYRPKYRWDAERWKWVPVIEVPKGMYFDAAAGCVTAILAATVTLLIAFFVGSKL